jgi:serine protease Do
MQKLITFFIFIFLLSSSIITHAEIPNELIYNLKGTIVKVRSINQSGGKSLGTGVVVAENHVATNCHVISDTIGLDIVSLGEAFQPVGLQADWKHDICILNFQFLPLKPATLGDSEALSYEDPIFSIGFPGGAPKPLTTFGSIKALYPFDDSHLVRISTSFQMGASGSPVFNEKGEVIALSTFKSPGRRNAYYYNVPIKWVKLALNLPVGEITQKHEHAFWEADQDKKPYWMQIVIPLQNEDWPEIEKIVQKWITESPQDQESNYYHALVLSHLGRLDESKQALKRIVKKNPNHVSAIAKLAEIALLEGNELEVDFYKTQLARFDQSY